jgi:hypothetical protein
VLLSTQSFNRIESKVFHTQETTDDGVLKTAWQLAITSRRFYCRGKIMNGKQIRKYAGIITTLFFLAASIPSVLSPAEGTTAGPGARTAGTGTVGPTAGGTTLTGIGVGTIAVGTVIAEAAVIAVAASQSNSSNPATIH